MSQSDLMQTGSLSDEATKMSDQSAERVTAVIAAPPTRQQKDPKKVAAGRAGAAARKAKEEKLLQELRAAKEHYKMPTHELPMEHQLRSNKTQTKDTPPAHETEEQVNNSDWTPWVIGGAALTAMIWFRSMMTCRQSQSHQAASLPETSANTQKNVASGTQHKVRDQRQFKLLSF